MSIDIMLIIIMVASVVCAIAAVVVTGVAVHKHLQNPPVRDFSDLFDRHPRVGKIEMERGDQWTIYYHDAANPNEPFPLSSLRPDSQLRQDIERLDRRASA